MNSAAPASRAASSMAAWRRRAAERDVIGDGAGEQVGALRDPGELRRQGSAGMAARSVSADVDGPRCRLGEPQQQRSREDLPAPLGPSRISSPGRITRSSPPRRRDAAG